MPEPPDDEQPLARPRELGDEVGARETRKLRAQREPDRTVWFGLGTFGLVGWSVAIPTVAGVALGVWLDMTWPGPFSWTLALLLAGAALGSLNAWYWVSKEQQAIDRERKKPTDD
jgi:ATP synthase protein I